MTRIFLCYAHPDREVASRVRAELLKAGFAVFWDDDIGFADDWMEALNNAVYESDRVVALLSDPAFKSKFVLGVLEFTAHLGKPIFPLYTGDFMQLQIALPAQIDFLGALEWADAADSAGWLSALLSDDEFGSSTREIPDSLWLSLEESAHGGAENGQSAEPPEPSPPAASVRPEVAVPAPPAQLPMDALTLDDEAKKPGSESELTPQVGAGPIAFSGYAPKEIPAGVWQPLIAYVFRESARADAAADASAVLGAALGNYRPVDAPALTPIAEGALITATPELPGFQFNPPSASIALFELWHRFDFKLRVKDAPAQQAANGRIVFSVEGILVADLPLSVYVQAPGAAAPPPSSAARVEVKPYASVFCSYSHKDTPIIERVERVIKLMGYDYLRDATALRSGEQWNDALLRMIDRADIFQLFWSTNSAASKYVRQEWEYALARSAGKPAFIRPVYWEQPMPPPPPELNAIHFAFDPALDD